MFVIEFKDGVRVTIKGEEDVEVDSLSTTDIHFNSVANKAQTNETEYLRLCTLINNRLGVEVL